MKKYCCKCHESKLTIQWVAKDMCLKCISELLGISERKLEQDYLKEQESSIQN